MYVGMQLIN